MLFAPASGSEMPILQLKRRNFITMLGGAAAAWPLAARAQQVTLPVVGLLDSRSQEAVAGRLRAFRQGLQENGYVEGENVAIMYRWAENQFDRLPDLASDLVHRRVAVIATAGDPATSAAKAATTTIPIAFVIAEDPVRAGLVANIARPGGNITGINFLAAELTAKRLELLRELVPRAARVAVLVNPAEAKRTESTMEALEAAARMMALQIQVLKANTNREIEAAFDTIERQRADALFIETSPFLNVRNVQLAMLAAYHHVAGTHSEREYVNGRPRYLNCCTG
jgi:putative tryptophan/tyrosine transport system substrate-binding protein